MKQFYFKKLVRFLLLSVLLEGVFYFPAYADGINASELKQEIKLYQDLFSDKEIRKLEKILSNQDNLALENSDEKTELVISTKEFNNLVNMRQSYAEALRMAKSFPKSANDWVLASTKAQFDVKMTDISEEKEILNDILPLNPEIIHKLSQMSFSESEVVKFFVIRNSMVGKLYKTMQTIIESPGLQQIPKAQKALKKLSSKELELLNNTLFLNFKNISNAATRGYDVSIPFVAGAAIPKIITKFLIAKGLGKWVPEKVGVITSKWLNMSFLRYKDPSGIKHNYIEFSTETFRAKNFSMFLYEFGFYINFGPSWRRGNPENQAAIQENSLYNIGVGPIRSSPEKFSLQAGISPPPPLQLAPGISNFYFYDGTSVSKIHGLWNLDEVKKLWISSKTESTWDRSKRVLSFLKENNLAIKTKFKNIKNQCSVIFE